MKVCMGEPRVIVQGVTPEEDYWGSYQFPIPYKTENGVLVSVHVADDDFRCFKQDTKRWFHSTDNGETWQEVDVSKCGIGGLKLPNGDLLFFPEVNSTDVSHYTFENTQCLTPDYDMTKKAPEGVIPMPDYRAHGISGYLAERLPDSLSKKEWLSYRTYAGSDRPVEEMVPIEWPYYTRIVYDQGDSKTLRCLYPHGRPKMGPDGAVWISTFSGEGNINPETGLYEPYFSAEIFRSEDNGHSFKRHAHMRYPADGSKEYPYACGGFSDNDFEFMPDGSMIWFFRTAWGASSGREWSPMYFAHSTDMGRTWTKPVQFSWTGIYPSLCTLTGGTKLLCYARPGVFVTANENESGTKWCEPLVLMPAEDRSHLANVPPKIKRFHTWAGGCNNPKLVALNDNTALIIYSDFYYPDEKGVKRKSILSRRLWVEE